MSAPGGEQSPWGDWNAHTENKDILISQASVSGSRTGRRAPTQKRSSMNIVPCLPSAAPAGEATTAELREAGCLRHPGGRVSQRCPTAYGRSSNRNLEMSLFHRRSFVRSQNSPLFLIAPGGRALRTGDHQRGRVWDSGVALVHRRYAIMYRHPPQAKKSTHVCPCPFGPFRGYVPTPQVGPRALTREACGP